MPRQKQRNVLTEQDAMEVDEIKSEIDSLPTDDPKTCEGLLRDLYNKISEIEKGSVKERLLSKLRAASCSGLNNDLRVMIKENGLNFESICLVLKYLTTKEELAQYLFTTPENAVEKDGLGAVSKRLGPKLEVLGGLSAKGIHVTEDNWVKNLVQATPSLSSLSRISEGDLKVRLFN